MAIEQEYCGARGRNYFKEDQLAQKLLKEILPESIRAETFERLEKFGELCGGKIASLVEAAHQDGKYAALKKYDRWGKRIDKVLYCPEQLEARRLALKAGVLPPTPLIERMTMAYLLNQNGEGGITCPLAMTDGLADLLEERGSDEQKQKYLPLLRDPATQTPLTGGQFVTEQQGGSNVSENETLAEEAPDGTWRLTGLKWFCSNPGELWVTTAKPKGSSHVGLFLVPRRLPGGELNEAHILRLKDLSGTRGKATAEVEYRGARAEMIGRPLQGISILLSSVLKTSRIHVAAASLGFIRRAYWEAKLYSEQRVNLGHPISEFPNVKGALYAMENVLETSSKAFFAMLKMLDTGHPVAEILVPLLKIQLSESATWTVRQARLIFAGNATLRDFSILPRLAEDALIQEIWEGTHPILAGHVTKALCRQPARDAFLGLLTDEMVEPLHGAIEEFYQSKPERKAERATMMATTAYAAFAEALNQGKVAKVLQAS